ncbi:SWIM zinc finger family protein [Chitinophaga sancti]|uniref:SWIM zinc finger n=1 Tax=Chitinophaga sancti TaxID=1004 RepID=A0A1K1SX95_9BACT|nr:SWIM zinc finger family protein [Chitinophaga sancti]WQD62282.1 SWIM zinc finger family protein [Chitinophaga sancti]WQG92149.1 SWIM zinc finger family protein [Chitinophaga sancti]SFW88977.1 SWIM zinc finger [Chitinophaga sancti]
MTTSDIITYQYQHPSFLDRQRLLLSGYNEISPASCFFQGFLNQPYIVARCLITLSNIVQSSFNLSPFQMAMMRDPIATAGNEKLRFEGFSHCAGVYARVDVLPAAIDGTFPASGTVNVDFNQPMINALGGVGKQGQMMLNIGADAISVQTTATAKVVERKVPLPLKWIKGLTSVQIFLSAAEQVYSFNQLQAMQLFKSIPAGQPKPDYYLVMRGNKPMFSPAKAANAICVGGIHRLKLLEPLLPLASELKVFAGPDMQSTTWQLYFGDVRFSFSLSRESWRGFSGEGAALESLVADVPDEWLDAMNKYSHANQEFNPALMAISENIHFEQVDQLTGRMAAMGLLGYDLDERQFFYRQLPFKQSRILQLNPRMKDAEKLLEEDKVVILKNENNRVEARVEGSGVQHTVIIDPGKARCTCTWYAKHQGERGPCKHILAVKIKIG